MAQVNHADTSATPNSPNIQSVSEVTSKIKVLIEKNLPYIWINGEISNLNFSTAGHLYFILKDATAQINAVMFKNQRRGLMFTPENGMNINCLGRLSVYEERGAYQIIVEFADQAGVGTQHLEFEQLKLKLEREGLFAGERKRPLPAYPRKIVLITSQAGAVVHDMQVVARRKMPVVFDILPVKVQGAEAVIEIVNALEFLKEIPDAEVAVLARGGGSAEDMQAFNSEEVARAIALSPIPVVSAVGHETDFSISDFVADLRAPTPSAAIDMLLPDKEELELKLLNLTRRVMGGLQKIILLRKTRLNHLEARLGTPKYKLLEYHQKVTYYEYKLKHNMLQHFQAETQRLGLLRMRLNRQAPQIKLNNSFNALKNTEQKLKVLVDNILVTYQNKILSLQNKISLLGPLATLERGYSIVTKPLFNGVINNVNMVEPGETLEIIMQNGRVWCIVQKVKNNG